MRVTEKDRNREAFSISRKPDAFVCTSNTFIRRRLNLNMQGLIKVNVYYRKQNGSICDPADTNHTITIANYVFNDRRNPANSARKIRKNNGQGSAGCQLFDRQDVGRSSSQPFNTGTQSFFLIYKKKLEFCKKWNGK